MYLMFKNGCFPTSHVSFRECNVNKPDFFMTQVGTEEFVARAGLDIKVEPHFLAEHSFTWLIKGFSGLKDSYVL